MDKLIDWWLGKSPEERTAVLADPATTEAQRANIEALEQYCLDHCYDVFVKSSLRPRPFAAHLLGAKSSPATLSSLFPFTSVGGRYHIMNEERAEAVKHAEQHLSGVAQRLGHYMRGIHWAPHRDEAWRMDAAQQVVRVLVESVVAAMCRQRIHEDVEAQERADNQSSKRKLKLSLAQGASAAGQNQDGRAAALHPGLAPRPIAAHLREVRGWIGMWELLGANGLGQPTSATSGEGEAAHHHHHHPVRRGTVLPWTELRERLQAQTPSHAGNSGDHAPSSSSSVLASARITARDVRFAIAHLDTHGASYGA